MTRMGERGAYDRLERFPQKKKGQILASPDPCPLPGHEWDRQRPVKKARRTVGSARSVPP